MKIRFFIIGMTLWLIPVMGIAQPKGPGPVSKEARQRIEAQRIGFITQKLSLTPEEATKFWPVYNQYKDGLRDMRDEMERPDLMNITDEEATTIIEKHLQQEQKRVEMKKKLFAELHNVISPRKIIMLHAAEMEFNRELLRKANAMSPGPGHQKMN